MRRSWQNLDCPYRAKFIVSWVRGRRPRLRWLHGFGAPKEDCGDLSRKSIGDLHAVAAGAGLQSFQEEGSLRFRLGEFKRFAELFGSSCMIAQSHLELADYGIKQVVGIQFFAVADGAECL